MCFSETASFTAAAVLFVQGLASVNLVKNYKKFFLIACIPFLFAIQQLSEGMLWHYFNNNININGPWAFPAKVFLSIAFLIWPIFIPLSVMLAENVKWKKWLLRVFVAGGILWASYLISAMPYVNLNVSANEHGILYKVDHFTNVEARVMKVLYLSLVIIPIFISSLRYLWVFGLATLISAGIADHFYKTTFTSVWCFFGALLSLLLYFILKANLKRA
jgi:hypothetical protein